MGSQTWLTETGAEGSVEVYRDDTGGVTIHTDALDEKVQLSLTNADGLAEHLHLDRTTELQITVRTFAYSNGDDPHRVFAELEGSEDGLHREITTDSEDEGRSGDSGSEEQQSSGRSPDHPGARRTLSQLRGDGARVTLDVWVVEQSGARSDAVLQYGKLADHSIDGTYSFIVFDNEGTEKLHPRKRYRLEQVKDDYYEQKDRQQVAVDGRSSIESMGSRGDPPAAVAEANSDDEFKSLSDIGAEHLEDDLDPTETPER